MNFDDYQEQAAEFCRYPAKDKLLFYCLGLGGETGEVLEKVKKMYRDRQDSIDIAGDVLKELGDVLWYLSRIADAFNLALSDVAHANIAKLTDRRYRDVLKGSGDNR